MGKTLIQKSLIHYCNYTQVFSDGPLDTQRLFKRHMNPNLTSDFIFQKYEKPIFFEPTPGPSLQKQATVKFRNVFISLIVRNQKIIFI